MTHPLIGAKVTKGWGGGSVCGFVFLEGSPYQTYIIMIVITVRLTMVAVCYLKVLSLAM